MRKRLFSKAAAKVLQFFELSKIFVIFFQKKCKNNRFCLQNKKFIKEK